MTPIDTFTSFARLPSEIRLKIWESAIPPARVVPVRYNRRYKQYTSDAPPHALLHACAESRQVYLSTHERFKLSRKFDSAIFVDFSRDTIFFDTLDCSPEGDLAYDLARSPQSQKILHCAIDSQVWEVLRVFRFDSLSEVKTLRHLKTLALVLRQDHDRGLRQTRTMQDGRNLVRVDVADTVGSEIQHVHYLTDCIRAELEHERDPQWEAGPPNIQMWIM